MFGLLLFFATCEEELIMTNEIPSFEGPVCALPLAHQDQIVIGHGSGGRMTHDLIRKVFQPFFSNPALNANNDFAEILTVGGNKLAISTDAHIVSPLFFPGGDIGRLAVCGTVNDVAMSGADPVCLTASFIIEEGFAVAELEKIARSMSEAAKEAGIYIAAGDTKVVEKGKADGLFISTTGIGFISEQLSINGSNAQPGDAVLISGTLGDHGIAVLSARGELGFETQIESDVAPMNSLVNLLTDVIKDIHVLRDPTRGGLATTLNEIALQSNVNITIEETEIPVNESVGAACELLGFDPLYVANEGKVIVILPQEYAEQALSIMKSHKYGQNAARIGIVNAEPKSLVLLKTRIGSNRVLDVMAGEMLPRIC
jgi:hydrogenase expression/formation protein HypE